MLCRSGLCLSIITSTAGSLLPRPATMKARSTGTATSAKRSTKTPPPKSKRSRSFKQALAIAPDSARDKLNYALALLRRKATSRRPSSFSKKCSARTPPSRTPGSISASITSAQGDTKRAIAQFEGMLQRTPDEAVAHFQLGTLYRQASRNADALKQFETAAKLDPQMAAARFQLYNMYRRAGDTATARPATSPTSSACRQLQKTWVIPEDVEWCELRRNLRSARQPARKPLCSAASYNGHTNCHARSMPRPPA